MSDKDYMISIGIDIGTSTTQLIFSKIRFKNSGSVFTVPRIEIADKELLYKSAIYFTPLVNEEIIDFTKIVEIVDHEYQHAGISQRDVDIGAVIITGESARKHNSNEVIELLSAYAGDFVVASAGVDLESVIAAKGAGADIVSKEKHQRVLHIDIGGGTSNYCLLDEGDVIETGCFDIGGRLIKLNENQAIYHLTPKAQTIIDKHHLNLHLNEYASLTELQKFCDILVKVIEMSVGLRNVDEDYDLLVTHKGIKKTAIDAISYSGGVADNIYYHYDLDDLEYHDIGIILARKIKESSLLNTIPLSPVLQTLQATVVGAGMHTTKLSGSTIFCEANNLPLKNVSIIKLSQKEISDINNISGVIKERVNWYDYHHKNDKVALAFEGDTFYSFDQITAISQQIVTGMQEYLQQIPTLIIIMENDYAKALGFSLKTLLDPTVNLISLDSIVVNQGDYIDIGNPMISNHVLPVIVKTIVFN